MVPDLDEPVEGPADVGLHTIGLTGDREAHRPRSRTRATTIGPVAKPDRDGLPGEGREIRGRSTRLPPLVSDALTEVLAVRIRVRRGLV
jgi:hypothetical protein